MIKSFLKKLKIHPRAWFDALFTYPRFLGSIKPALLAGAEAEMRTRLAALDSRWWKSSIQAPIGKRLLVISPHPDDEALGAGGLLLAHRGKSEIHIINIFNGNGGGQIENLPWQETEEYQNKLVQIRRDELAAVGRILKAASIQYLGLKDGESIFSANTAARLKQMISVIRPDVVLIPSFLDGHRDHQAANSLYAWSASDIECMILAFDIWSLGTPNAIFDITEHLELKLDLVRQYKSQTHTIDYAGYVEALARVRAFHSNIKRGEHLGAAEGFWALPNRDYCDLVKALYGTSAQPTEKGKEFC